MDPHSLIITKLEPSNHELIHETADLLYRAFSSNYPNAWPTIETALSEVEQSFGQGRISIIAQCDGKVVGWIGGIQHYDGHVYELHPIVVDVLYQRRGIGTLLIRALEHEVHARGAITIWLGTDDEDSRTSVSGIDLYPDVLDKLGAIQNLNFHPYEFYLKNGFSIVGILPDANGYGKPDIYMAKRVLEKEVPMSFPFNSQNTASRKRLEAIVGSLSEADLRRTNPDGWTVAALLAHLAYWDQRIVALLQRWQASGVDESPVDPDAVNEALKPLLLALEPRKAIALCLAAAEAADAALEAISPILVEAIQASPNHFRFDRSLHRLDHLTEIERLLGR